MEKEGRVEITFKLHAVTPEVASRQTSSRASRSSRATPRCVGEQEANAPTMVEPVELGRSTTEPIPTGAYSPRQCAPKVPIVEYDSGSTGEGRGTIRYAN